ncbi:long-chain-fatty-acid--CoA ligase [Mucilaginibacter gotjawali]|uniref:Long-chain-fatty-acid--CoA ligase n=2 Tax=Mucilaginibacter gotjawali TaxID=1550579 RepID=A0A0X8X1C7_9SPHI|nr:long-chain fatty acid--CoA ligase [Mucilaginibacter gotjawali]MBB3053730.1 long-chain acyl-CoA synthetase [Mucilaginibacter gotjawali]BAU53989.1 Long-chain-fatty-acid--CoA ligase [Mucilaginibacter gotjawali]
MLNLSVILEDSANRYPVKPAFTFMDTSLTYSQVNGYANQVANGLRAIGIRAGDKVALGCPNLPYFPIVYFGILKAGAVVVPLNVLLKKEEIEYHLRDSDAKAYFCFAGTNDFPMGETGYAAFNKVTGCENFIMIMPKPGMASGIEGVTTLSDFMADQPASFEMHQTSAEDTCVIIYTSGTTGQPKGAELTHSNLLLNAIAICDQMDNDEDDIALIVLPLFHIFGMTVMMNAGVYKGRSGVMLIRFDAESVFEAMQKHKVTLFAGVPTMYWGLLNYTDPKFDYESIAKTLKVCCSGGASLPVKVLQDFEKRFNVPIVEGYGMSEGSPVVTFNQLKTIRKPGSIGKPFWGVEVKLVDDDGAEVPIGEKGELLYRGHNVMKGYYKKPEETQKALKNGWMHSGDIAIKDEDGFFYIVDRTKDMIIRGGMKIYPREVEELMIKHEAVSLVAVVGTPHDEKGEEVKAFVVLKGGYTISEAELIAWTKERIASYKYPRNVEFIDALPMNATGKILKRELRGRD